MDKTFKNIFNPDAIKLAFYRVQSWPDKIVKDIRAFDADRENNCCILSKKMLSA